MYRENNILSREEALRLYTRGSSWFSTEEAKKGTLEPGQLADLVVLSDDYFSVPEKEIKNIESVITVVDGKIVYAVGDFRVYDQAPIPVLPEWSPIAVFGGYGAPLDVARAARAGVPIEQNHRHTADCRSHGCMHAAHRLLEGARQGTVPKYSDFWCNGCGCYAF